MKTTERKRERYVLIPFSIEQTTNIPLRRTGPTKSKSRTLNKKNTELCITTHTKQRESVQLQLDHTDMTQKTKDTFQDPSSNIQNNSSEQPKWLELHFSMRITEESTNNDALQVN